MPTRILDINTTLDSIALVHPELYQTVIDFDTFIANGIPGQTNLSWSTEPASGIYIGNGVILTASHVYLGINQTVAGPNVTANLSIGNGIFGVEGGGNNFYTGFDPRSQNILTNPDTPQFTNQSGITFNNIGGYFIDSSGAASGSDFSIVTVPSIVAPSIAILPRMLIFSDQNEAAGNLWNGGYQIAGSESSNREFGEILYETFGTLNPDSYNSGTLQWITESDLIFYPDKAVEEYG